MSVIAKLSINNVAVFGTGQLVELACVCANDLMAAYAESEEDRLFTKYSPSGDIKLHQPSGFVMGDPPTEFRRADVFYVIAVRADETEADQAGKGSQRGFPGAAAYTRGRCVSLTDFGDQQSKRVEFREAGTPEQRRGIEKLSWKMSVDNPPATAQFLPGVSDYWLVFYPEARFDRNAAIRAAHGHPEPAPAQEVADAPPAE